jgi:pyrroloquinoline quinone (PQQ) biosynthesis protein C
VAALAAVVAYEVQAPAVAASKAEGLRARYGLDDDGTRFWDVHAGIDEGHGDWMLEALGTAWPTAPTTSSPRPAPAADAWWSFLDEREAAAPITVAC